ncbi:hypothetical protein ILP92_13965 [Maribius pontilimi]|uniref:Uncharacterized protein n=1 Tax=Palleronia pontilimi TaxID=1964209 RepID=A0A934IJ32_9RHOB|nr:hypothetical protein [Palleronia pontilimi]MBJ3763856.1 hypothetical protein [Palleronia pontilimi]
MPKIIEREVGKIVHRQKVKTFGDKVKEVLQGIASVAFVLILIGLFIVG